MPTVEDVAPTSSTDPQGTVEFYAIIFLSIGATVGAALFGRMMGSVRRASTLALRTLSLAAYSALLAGTVTLYVDGVLGALTSHTWQIFGALWLYAMAVGGAVTGVSAALGTGASLAVTLFLVIVGNAAAAGPVGKPLAVGLLHHFQCDRAPGFGRRAAAQHRVLRRQRRADTGCHSGHLGSGRGRPRGDRSPRPEAVDGLSFQS